MLLFFGICFYITQTYRWASGNYFYFVCSINCCYLLCYSSKKVACISKINKNRLITLFFLLSLKSQRLNKRCGTPCILAERPEHWLPHCPPYIITHVFDTLNNQCQFLYRKCDFFAEMQILKREEHNVKDEPLEYPFLFRKYWCYE